MKPQPACVLRTRSFPDGDLDLLGADRFVQDFDDLLRICRRADKSFRLRNGRLPIVNADGFRIDVTGMTELRSRLLDVREMSEMHCRVFDELLDLAPVNAIAIARDGMPVPMTAMDPRAFTVLKFARSEFDQNRSGNAAEIDRQQAFAVGSLVRHRWPKEFEPQWLAPFPALAEHLGQDPQNMGPEFFRI